MRLSRLLAPIVALWICALPSVALAHAELETPEPPDGAVLDAPPEEVVLTFSDELDPDGSGFTVTDAGGAEVGTGSVDLDVAERNVLRGAVSVEEPGTYTVAWTSVASDGDELSGELTFTYGTDDDAEVPNTAAVERWPNGTLIAGLVLLGLGALLAVNRMSAAIARD